MTKDEIMKMGGDNFTRTLSFTVTHFQNVNVGTRTEDGLWTLTADAKTVKGDGLLGLADVCNALGVQPGIQNGQLLLLGRD